MSSVDGADVPRADPLALVRRWEAQNARVLIDPCLAAWEDLDSEAVIKARQHWRAELPSGTAYWSRRRYLSFDHAGNPRRLIEVRLLSGDQNTISIRHSDLLVAGTVGGHFWIYALTPAPGDAVRLTALQDPARWSWDPAKTGGGALQDPLWLLPLSRVAGSSVVLAAA